jgi:hypothetical protein
MPTGILRIVGGPVPTPAQGRADIVLGPDVFSYQWRDEEGWITRPLRDLAWIEWDEPPFDTEPDVLATLRQFIAQLSPDELEERITAAIGQDGLHRQGDWVRAALMEMLG